MRVCPLVIRVRICTMRLTKQKLSATFQRVFLIGDAERALEITFRHFRLAESED